MGASAYGALEKILDRLLHEEDLDEENGESDGESNNVDDGVTVGDVDDLGWETELNDQRRNQLQDLLKEWVRRKTDAVNEVNRILANAGLTMDAVWAEVLSERIDDIERIKRMIAGSPKRAGRVGKNRRGLKDEGRQRPRLRERRGCDGLNR